MTAAATAPTATAATATVEVIPRWHGESPSSGGTGGITKGHLATQVKALIQSEKNIQEWG